MAIFTDMKRQAISPLLVLVLSLLTATELWAQWTLRPFPTGFDAYFRVHNRSRDTVIAGGAPRCRSIWSTNRGTNWFTGESYIGIIDTISIVKHVSTDRIIVAVNDTYVNTNLIFGLYTNTFSSARNGVSPWSASSVITQSDYMEDAYFFPYTSLGVMVGRPRGYVYRTTDAGVTWTQVTCPNSNRLVRVDFADSQTGYAVGPSSNIVKTTNGGLSWTRLMPTTAGISNNKSLNSVDFVTPLVGYIGAGDGVYKTIDGGVTFTKLYNKRVQAVAFWTPTTGFLSDADSARLTTDGGVTWKNSEVSLRDLSCDKQGYCYGINVLGVYHYDNPTPLSLENSWTKEASFYPNPLPVGEPLSYYVPLVSGAYNIQVFNAKGQVMYKATDLPQGKGQLPINLPQGLYIIQLQAQGQQWRQKIIVN